MLELRKFVVPEFIFGLGAVDLVGQYAGNFGAGKALIVSDAGVVATGLVDRVREFLGAARVDSSTYTDISPNPRAEQVMTGACQYAEEGCDIIIAVGGGSPMDCAKGIGIVTTNQRHILEFEGIDNVDVPGPPLICLPTTAGTSADVSQFAIITAPERRVKVAIVSKTMVPDVALIDPAVTATMDPYLTACTGLDTLVHAFEAYVSNAHAPICDLHALNAIKLIFRHLPEAMRLPEDLEIRGRIAQASLEAGIAFSNASLGAVHAMAHSCGGLLDMAHGECNAILLDHVVAYNFRSVPERYRDIAAAIGIGVEAMDETRIQAELLARIRDLKAAAGIEVGLSAKGARAADIPELARKAYDDPCLVTNPREASPRDIEVIYEEAL